MKNVVKILSILFLTLTLICNFSINTYAISEIINESEKNVENNSVEDEIKFIESNNTSSENNNTIDNNIIDNETEANQVDEENTVTNNESNSIQEAVSDTTEAIESESIDEDLEQNNITTYSNEISSNANPTGLYKMSVGKTPNKAIEVKGGDINNNAIIDIWDYGNALWQKFYFEYQEEGYYKITSMHTRKSLTAKDNRLEEGTQIVQEDYEGLDSQKWILRDSGKNGWIISLLSNPELSISISGSIINGAEIILSKTEDNDSQMFYLYNITSEQKTYENGTYRMAVGADLEKAMQVEGDSDNSEINLGKYGNKTSQKFNLEYQEGGYYKITSLNSGKSLTAKNGNLTEGTEVVLADYQELDSQKWILRDSNINGWIISLFSNPQLSITVQGNIENDSKIILSQTEDSSKQIYNILGVGITEGEKQQNGMYKIAAAADSNKAIEVKGGDVNNNAIIDIWDYGNALWQKFYFEYQEEGYYKITSMHTRKSLTAKDNRLEEGTQIVQEDYEGLDSQKWILRDSSVNGWVISSKSNPELSISIKENITNGAEMILSKSEDNINQKFYLYNITSEQKTYENGTYRMAVGADLEKAMQVEGDSDNSGINLGKYGNRTSQKFNLEYQDGGYYKITSLNSGKSLTAKNGNLTEGTEVVLADYQELDSQKWILRDSNINGGIISLLSNPQLSITVEGNIENGSRIVLSKTEDNSKQIYNILGASTIEGEKQQNGIYKMSIVADTSKAIEIKGGDKSNNAIADIWDYGSASWQEFYFEYQEEGYYKITAMHTGKSLTAKDNKLEKGTEIVQADYEGLDSQKWILRDTSVNGWVISLQSNPELSISVEESISNGSEIILSKTEDTNNQLFYLYNITSSERTQSDGVYKVSVGKDPNKAIEVKGGDKSNNAIVDIWDYGNGNQQRFNFEYIEGYYKITARHTGKSLTAKDNKLEEGTEIVQTDYQELDSQKWILRDSGKNGWIISLLSNPELSITINGNIENGDSLVLSSTEDNDNQMFYLNNITSDLRTHSDGVYKMVVGKDQNKAVEVKGGDKNNNAIVDIWDYGNGNQQRFNLEYKEGFYKITARHTGKSLTVKDNKLEDGTEIVQADYEGLDSQKWILRDSGINGWIISLLSNPDLSITINGNIANGDSLILSKTEDNDNQMFCLYNITSELRTHEDKIYKITVGVSSNKAIEIKGGYGDNNATADIWDYGNATWQRFYLEYLDGFYKITAMHTGKALTVKDNNLQQGAEIVQYDYQGLDSQKWILRDSWKNGWVISLLSNSDLSITVDGNIGNGSRLILSTTQDNNNQMFYISQYEDKNAKEGTYGQSGLMYKGTGGSYLKYYQIGKGSKHLFLNFAIHGFEDNYSYDGQELTYMADEFYEYLKDNMPNDLVEEWTIYIMPSSNPDGEYNGWTNDGPGRTTLYSWAPGNQGIDMNRCFSVGYKRETSARNYNGTEPFQAYEAQALRDFILNNRGSQNIVIDVHGWLNETIGDDGIGAFYRNEFGISHHIDSYGAGYLVNWARSIGARSMLLELPPVYSHSQVVNNNYVGKFTNATMNLLRSF